MTLIDMLPPGVSVEDLIVLMAGLTAAASSLAVWAALLHRDPATRRARVMCCPCASAKNASSR